jgi:hypothetical protein
MRSRMLLKQPPAAMMPTPVSQRAHALGTGNQALLRIQRSVSEEGDAVPSNRTCESDESEGFPLLLKGMKRPAVGYAQDRLNETLELVLDEIGTNGPGWNSLPKLNRDFINIQLTKLGKNRIKVSCTFDEDTKLATLIAQAFYFQLVVEWDGKIGPNTWDAILPRLEPEPHKGTYL